MNPRTFTLINDNDKAACVAYIVKINLGTPMEVEIREAQNQRSLAQNALAFRWYTDISRQTGQTPQEERGYCKLHIGIGILKSGTSKLAVKFTEQYDSIIRPLPYEKKLELMLPPIELPVTSLMNIKQMTEYLDQLQRHFAEKGISLSAADDIYSLAMGRNKNA